LWTKKVPTYELIDRGPVKSKGPIGS